MPGEQYRASGLPEFRVLPPASARASRQVSLPGTSTVVPCRGAPPAPL